MANKIALKTDVQIGVVPTHIKFVGGLAPGEDGKLPRNEAGEHLAVVNHKLLAEQSEAPITMSQISYFPGTDDADVDSLIQDLQALGLDVHMILMVGGADPMKPEDEDAVVEMLSAGINVAKRNGVENVSSTSIEEWMQEGAVRKEGADYEAAIAQNAKVHSRVYHETDMVNSSIKNWHIEFLRGIEFQTFTNIGRAWDAVKAINESIGSDNKYFKILVDSAHCGDSELSIDENIELIKQVAAADEFGVFHASVPTTRGCVSTDDGWVGALLSAAASTGKLKYVFSEVFHHDDPALAPLREKVANHGIDTTDGRSYDQTLMDNLKDVARRLNNLSARGIL